MFRLPRLTSNVPIVDKEGRPASVFAIAWQQLVERVERAIQAIVDITGIQEQFDLALQQAQEATAAAQAAADAAQEAADAAGSAAANNAREVALQTSTIDPISVLTATPTTITVAPHTRPYGDGTSAVVAGASFPASATGDTDYVYYDDPMRTGGTVLYQVSLTQPIQTGDRHVVGAVVIPATGTVDGGAGPRPPGYVDGNPIP